MRGFVRSSVMPWSRSWEGGVGCLNGGGIGAGGKGCGELWTAGE